MTCLCGISEDHGQLATGTDLRLPDKVAHIQGCSLQSAGGALCSSHVGTGQMAERCTGPCPSSCSSFLVIDSLPVIPGVLLIRDWIVQ